MDRVSRFGREGRRFESYRGHKKGFSNLGACFLELRKSGDIHCATRNSSDQSENPFRYRSSRCLGLDWSGIFAIAELMENDQQAAQEAQENEKLHNELSLQLRNAITQNLALANQRSDDGAKQLNLVATIFITGLLALIATGNSAVTATIVREGVFYGGALLFLVLSIIMGLIQLGDMEKAHRDSASAQLTLLNQIKGKQISTLALRLILESEEVKITDSPRAYRAQLGCLLVAGLFIAWVFYKIAHQTIFH